MARSTIADYLVYDTPERLAQAAAEVFAKYAVDAVAARGVARIAISGGTTPKSMFALLATEPFLGQVPWDKLHLYWVDERCVSPEDADSNFRMTFEQLLCKVPLPAENVYRMEGEMDPEEAANRYEAILRNTFRLEGAQAPAFDLILLGMGDDGHTASLFPHTDAIDAMGRLVVANFVPQKDTWRITLTWTVINQGKRVVFLIEGGTKADRLHEVLLGDYDPERLPAQLIRPENGHIGLLLDAEAARRLPKVGMVDDAETGTLELTR
ncbi:6-phosphogluconolactonase [Terriglobus roseus DSM 18391]|uniref:6-phosphogluconolactonase n=1 Tax=Terriglobus roseus (strain DSM 18391 / NRRL B-41598 / KBS 63) TaxID=926566 RepID=I3ZDK2_TERRK|nr:6-phosphogluconolactonase [Terriglobus roseus]AFL87320.1 6-phosphogluconolactonase [Terriglobus roseus DSM 18391]